MEHDGIGWLTVGSIGLGVGLILVGVGTSQAVRHRRWVEKYQARLTPSFRVKRGQGWTLGATLRF
jgi:hypothetical protein